MQMITRRTADGHRVGPLRSFAGGTGSNRTGSAECCSRSDLLEACEALDISRTTFASPVIR